tara:strand:+ start:1011 stop:2351 length:1341 start_codon:yes stop_codon:yes gene_type:complete
MISISNKKVLKEFNIDKLGHIFFLIGVFLLASAVGVSILFFLTSVFISFLKPRNFFKDKWNYPFILSSFFMIFSTLVHLNRSLDSLDSLWDPKLSVIGLLNWIPLFLSFWAFQKYLDTHHKRLLTAKLLICGSIPVIFSGILQLLSINGPFQVLNGLIIWFQKPLSEVGSLSGLFNNQNYAGLWMVMVWPFCLSELIRPKRELAKKILLIAITISFLIFITLTDSRNAFLGLIISSPIVLGSSSLIWYLPIIAIALLILALTVIPIFPIEIQIFMKSIVPARIYTLFPEIGFEYFKTYPRINKLNAALIYIFNKPIFGWGAASFPILYEIKSGEWFGHVHNLPLELAISYGIIPSLIIFSTYICLLYLSFKKINKFSHNSNKIIDNHKTFHKAWSASSLIFFISHLADIQYFDGRISIFCWILLAGMRAFIKEENNYTNYYQKIIK